MGTKVVFIQLEEVDLSQAVDLKHLLEDSPVVKWNDPGFWNKLRYFLPEPVYLTFHRNVTMRGTLQTSNLYQPVLGSQGLEGATDHKADHHHQHHAHLGQQYQPSSVYGSEHTYHSIDNNHIYHTLDPGSNPNVFLQFQPAGGGVPANRVFINRTLDMINPPHAAVAQPQTMHRGHVLAVGHVTQLQQAVARSPPAAVDQSSASRQIHAIDHDRSSFGDRSVNHSINHGRCSSTPIQHVHNNSQPVHHAHNTSQSMSHTPQSINHAHTNSTSSAKKLLSGEDGEYIV